MPNGSSEDTDAEPTLNADSTDEGIFGFGFVFVFIFELFGVCEFDNIEEDDDEITLELLLLLILLLLILLFPSLNSAGRAEALCISAMCE